MRIAVLGSSEFTLGFMLTGIKDIIEVSDNPINEINKIREDPNIGIVIVEHSVLDQIEELDKEEIEDSVSPVFISLSTNIEQDSLKRLIKKSIGIDVYR
ncbi:hypothetical protein K9M79_05370 [Candidatus Woesearchaeota archaeon]|nr:hypothetical protein [Candidatus Woesearchaeota archaeon]